MTDARPPTPSIPLEPPPPYDSLFAITAPPNSAEAPKFPQLLEQPLFMGYRCWVRLELVVPAHPPPYLINDHILIPLLKTH